jgi:hypothetical protein
MEAALRLGRGRGDQSGLGVNPVRQGRVCPLRFSLALFGRVATGLRQLSAMVFGTGPASAGTPDRVRCPLRPRPATWKTSLLWPDTACTQPPCRTRSCSSTARMPGTCGTWPGTCTSSGSWRPMARRPAGWAGMAARTSTRSAGRSARCRGTWSRLGCSPKPAPGTEAGGRVGGGSAAGAAGLRSGDAELLRRDPQAAEPPQTVRG